jgi:hypothetical protein
MVKRLMAGTVSVLLFILLIAAIQPVSAEGPTANMLRASCNYENLPAQHQQIAKTMCFAHLHGFMDYHKMLVFKKMDKLFCLPKGGVTLGTVRAFFMREIVAMPQEAMDAPSGFVLSLVLEKYFPCKN